MVPECHSLSPFCFIHHFFFIFLFIFFYLPFCLPPCHFPLIHCAFVLFLSSIPLYSFVLSYSVCLSLFVWMGPLIVPRAPDMISIWQATIRKKMEELMEMTYVKRRGKWRNLIKFENIWKENVGKISFSLNFSRHRLRHLAITFYRRDGVWLFFRSLFLFGANDND